MKILVINSGSSSIKFKVFFMPKCKMIAKGIIEHIGERGSKIKDHYAGLRMLLGKVPVPDAIGHRVVHGGERFRSSALIDAGVVREIRNCSRIAPLHNPANLAGIIACSRLLPGIKQVAVFDTAFYQSMPAYAYIYGLPYKYYLDYRIRKYGFHGTSHQYVALEAARRLNRPLSKLRLITCHLGNGCSISAIKNGRCIDTSMGLTPLEGLVMGTRCGDIDPAIVTYLMRNHKLNIAAIENILNKESGLKGISGISNDMRWLLRSRLPRAKLAIDIFVYRIKKYIGSYSAALGGVDALVFTAGIGEKSGVIRSKVCRGIFNCWRKKPKVLVVPTNEELLIARQTYNLAGGTDA